MKYQPIIGTLGYLLSKDRKKTLLIHRNKNHNDDHLGKYNGLGGKMMEGEDIYTSMKREILEESGLEVKKMGLRGTINWQGFGKNHEDWLGFIFRIEEYEGESKISCPEGDLKWVDLNTIHSLNMWEGDRYFLPMVFDNNPTLFHGVMTYRGEEVLDFNFVRENSSCS